MFNMSGVLPLQVGGIHLLRLFRFEKADRTVYPRSGSPHFELIKASEKARALWDEIEARSRLSPCWKRSFAALRSECATIRSDSVLRARLALGMAACDSESDDRGGASSFYCTPQQSPHKCVKELSEPAYAIFIQYRLHTDVLCAFLQEELFQQRTEAAVAALKSAADLGIDSLAHLQHSSVKLLRAAEETMETHQESKRLTVELQEDLQKLQDSQTNTLQGLHVSAHGILRLSKHTEESLLHLRESLNSVVANASGKLDELATQAAEHYAFMEQRTGRIFNVLKHIEAAHKKMTNHAISFRVTLQYVVVVFFIVLSTMSKRTAAARLPAFGFIVTGPLACMLAGGGRLGCGLWIVVTVGAAAITVGYFGYTYVSVEHLQRQMVHEEVMHAVHKSQMDFMAWMGARAALTPLNPTVSSAPAVARMSPGKPFLTSIAVSPFLGATISSNDSDEKRSSEAQKIPPTGMVLDIDVESSQTSSFEVAVPKKKANISAMKRPRTKSIPPPLDKSIGMAKSTQRNHKRRRRIDK